MTDVCFYHGNCVDGSLSAVCAKLAYPEIELIPLFSRNELPSEELWKKRHVVMIDFSLSKELLDQMDRGTASFLLLDHHKTAYQNLSGEKYAVFDMNRSGAEMAWKHFFPDSLAPLLIRAAGENDRGLNAMPETAAIMDYGYQLTFSPADWLQYMQDLECNPEQLLLAGKQIGQWKKSLVKDTAAQKAFKTKLGRHEVWAINSSLFKNELADELCQYGKFAIVYSGHDGAWYWSLRSRDGFDVEQLAAANGGGGHAGAAAFVAEYAPMKISSEKLPVRLPT